MPLMGKPRRPLETFSKMVDDDADDSMDRFRKSLEDSWDIKSMGVVPTSAESAAEASAISLESAVDKTIFFINILVPQYDISSGAKYYDEVLAVEFCIALAKRLSEPSMICVRDSAVLSPVQRVLNAREKEKSDSAGSVRSESSSNAPSEDPFGDASMAPTGSISDGPIPSESSDVENFRAKLMTDWAPDSDGSVTEETATRTDEPVESPKMYRLTSMLGDARSFSTNTSSPMNEIVQAVSKNAMPKSHEGFILILAPSTKEEMIGVRALVQKYSGKKRFILVNSKLDPLPPELHNAETVYSVLPMIGKQIRGENADVQPPKVVLLRRYPRDWELYVDIGKGFDFAASCDLGGLSGGSFVTGPSQQWIKSNLESYLLKMR